MSTTTKTNAKLNALIKAILERNQPWISYPDYEVVDEDKLGNFEIFHFADHAAENQGIRGFEMGLEFTGNSSDVYKYDGGIDYAGDYNAYYFVGDVEEIMKKMMSAAGIQEKAEELSLFDQIEDLLVGEWWATQPNYDSPHMPLVEMLASLVEDEVITIGWIKDELDKRGLKDEVGPYCSSCKSTKDVTFAPCHLSVEIYGDNDSKWLCKSCRQQRAEEV